MMDVYEFDSPASSNASSAMNMPSLSAAQVRMTLAADFLGKISSDGCLVEVCAL